MVPRLKLSDSPKSVLFLVLLMISQGLLLLKWDHVQLDVNRCFHYLLVALACCSFLLFDYLVGFKLISDLEVLILAGIVFHFLLLLLLPI